MIIKYILRSTYKNTKRFEKRPKGGYIKYVGGGGWRVLQIFQKSFRSPGEHRLKYFMAQ